MMGHDRYCIELFGCVTWCFCITTLMMGLLSFLGADGYMFLPSGTGELTTWTQGLMTANRSNDYDDVQTLHTYSASPDSFNIYAYLEGIFAMCAFLDLWLMIASWHIFDY